MSLKLSRYKLFGIWKVKSNLSFLYNLTEISILSYLLYERLVVVFCDWCRSRNRLISLKLLSQSQNSNHSFWYFSKSLVHVNVRVTWHRVNVFENTCIHMKSWWTFYRKLYQHTKSNCTINPLCTRMLLTKENKMVNVAFLTISVLLK